MVMTSRLEWKAEPLPANGMLLRDVCIERQKVGGVLAQGFGLDVMGHNSTPACSPKTQLWTGMCLWERYQGNPIPYLTSGCATTTNMHKQHSG
jgi:hypothetical protein